MRIEFNTKYNAGDTVIYTDESYGITYRKAVVLIVSANYRSDYDKTEVSYYVRRYEDKNNLHSEWVPENALSDAHE